MLTRSFVCAQSEEDCRVNLLGGGATNTTRHNASDLRVVHTSGSILSFKTSRERTTVTCVVGKTAASGCKLKRRSLSKHTGREAV